MYLRLKQSHCLYLSSALKNMSEFIHVSFAPEEGFKYAPIFPPCLRKLNKGLHGFCRPFFLESFEMPRCKLT